MRLIDADDEAFGYNPMRDASERQVDCVGCLAHVSEEDPRA